MARLKRILLKLSGEMMAGGDRRGLSNASIKAVASQIAAVSRQGTQVAIVSGAGNLVRGAGPNRYALDVEQQSLDSMGMLATIINCTALADFLRREGCEVVHMCAFPSLPGTVPADAHAACQHLANGRIVLFSGGTGLPFFSTDTAAVVRALQIKADALLKATQVDGVYDRDPGSHTGEPARFLSKVSYGEAIEKRLRFMDLPALALASQNRLTIHVYNAHVEGNLAKLLSGKLECSQVGPQ
ncbi:MAG: UMP kinase [Deltaproteobacteria bacterium]|nr:UMP kinase [Deltaproteobacteria bacterium]